MGDPLYEGFGIPVLEAKMSGCPVVTSPVSSLTEVGGESVEYVDPKNSEAIAAGLAHVLGDPSYRNTLIESGKAHASQFTWQRTAQETIKLYHHILEQKQK